MREVVALINGATQKDKGARVPGHGKYKAKRLSEMVILCGLGQALREFYLLEADLQVLFGVWPIPENSRKGLRRIFGRLRTEASVQSAARIVSLALPGRGAVSVCTITALLCFREECRSHVLQWRKR